MGMIEWGPIKKMNPNGALFNEITLNELKKLYETLGNEYKELRKRNLALTRKLNKTFKNHPLKIRGKGWLYHHCGMDCYRQTEWNGKKGSLIHSFGPDREGDYI